MKDFEMLKNFLNKQIHEEINRNFYQSGELEISIDDAGFFTASGEWAEVQAYMTVYYDKTPIYGIYEDRFGDTYKEVSAVTLDERCRDISICKVTIGGRTCHALTAYAESILNEAEAATKEELQSMEWSIDDFSDLYEEIENNPYDDDYWHEKARDIRALAI